MGINSIEEAEDSFEADAIPDLEIVGLTQVTNGRSCTCHEVCGVHVKAGDVLRLKMTVVDGPSGEPEEAIKCVKIHDGSELCTVAFIPRIAARQNKVTSNVGRFVQVVRVYKDSPNSHERRLWHQNYGMASVVFMDDIPQQE